MTHRRLFHLPLRTLRRLMLTLSVIGGSTAIANAQTNAVFLDNLKSLRVEVNGLWNSDPVVPLGGRNYVSILFDDLQHNYVRYTYRITHCNADWTPSDLLESDYMDGFNGSRIEDYSPSMGTAMLYNHYTLRIPNDDVRLLVSGNYRVDIYEDGDDEPVAEACFSIVEQRVGVDISVTSNTDIDTYKQHQQVSFDLNYSTYRVNQPEKELYPVVVQNRRWDNHVEHLQPTYLKTNTLVFNHNRSLIFPAGNEYRRFEIMDEHVPTMRVESMQYHAPLYHAYIMTDEQRTAYLYDQDQDGRYLVRNGDNDENETESDYFITHFRLEMPELPDGNVYLHGDLTNNRFAEEYMMEYDHMEHAYTIALPLKQGSYNYQYIYLPNDSDVGMTAETEGDFYQTENEYAVYVYHRPFGERYDHLVGYQKIQYLGNQ
ncbi:MAG: DUF5103 domain-containing protein [Prevotellaceae bacterium]|nr:DUF5103 domain-containing protein [Prevotellaceae bacterium]